MITAAVSSASEFTGRPSSEWMLLALACAFANEVIGQCLAAVPPYPAQSVDWEIEGSVLRRCSLCLVLGPSSSLSLVLAVKAKHKIVEHWMPGPHDDSFAAGRHW